MIISKPNRPHFYLLLDRSGSMASMVDDVIGGFNQLLADQQLVGPDARLTLVQFDSQGTELLVDAQRITRVPPLDHSTFVPRGGTPLLDATGQLIIRAAVREQQRATLGKRPEIITFVTISDGAENASRQFTRRDILRLVKERQARNWSFAYLGAALDAYAEAGGMGYDARSVQAWAPDGQGASAAFSSLSAAMRARRAKLRNGEAYDVADLFEGSKPAEADRERRQSS